MLCACSYMIKSYHARSKEKSCKWLVRLCIQEKTLKIAMSSQLCSAPLLASTNSNPPSKCMTKCSVLAYLIYFVLMNNVTLLDIIMLSFRYCYHFISFRYCLLHTMNLNK